MRLLITTQSLDCNDPVLGFFHRWVEEFAKQCESIEVVCLRAGDYSLPLNVRVHSLGKEHGGLRLVRWARALRLIVGLRRSYDTVFVHMNPEYLVLAGWFWRLRGVRAVLWYTHKSVNIKLRVATLFASAVITASAESFRLPTKKLMVVGHGIDTNFFSPDPSVVREEWWLSAGRLNKSKRHDQAIRTAHKEGKELRILGDGPERSNLEALAQQLGARVVFLGAQTHDGVRDAFRRAALFVHTSETGSLDKMVLEAIACGCLVRTNDPALKHLENADSDYVRQNYSLSALVPRIVGLVSE